jgi:hypothetical protein
MFGGNVCSLVRHKAPLTDRVRQQTYKQPLQFTAAYAEQEWVEMAGSVMVVD